VSSQALGGDKKIATRLLVVLLEFKHSSRVGEVTVQRVTPWCGASARGRKRNVE
jgi:hypothetical protein